MHPTTSSLNSDPNKVPVDVFSTKKKKNALSVTRNENYSKWYLEVIKEAELADSSSVRGCMVIKPWGYGIWENIRSILDRKFKKIDVQNAYFPMFIPLNFFSKEANHVDGFAKECAVVTHYRLKASDGRIAPDSEALLSEPLVVRPTSETIIGDSFQKWIKSYRDLPLIINQWANVVRWEHETKPFLRTTEFLWQEGHTAHASEKDAIDQALKIADLYKKFIEKVLAIPLFVGEKSPGEKFAGAEKSFTFEAMMQDGKALQSGTSHYLGQNFSKAFDIKFLDKDQTSKLVYTTSWGLTTRLIGALIMVHSDDNGLKIPPRIASKQVVIIPLTKGKDSDSEVLEYAKKIERLLGKQNFKRAPLTVFLDKRDMKSVEKVWESIKKGIPLRIEIGEKELRQKEFEVIRRDDLEKKIKVAEERLPTAIPEMLSNMQQDFFKKALEYRDSLVQKNITTFEEFSAHFKKEEGPHGFVMAKWCGDPETEKILKDMKVTIRCIPFEQSNSEGKCVLTGKPAVTDAIFAKSY